MKPNENLDGPVKRMSKVGSFCNWVAAAFGIQIALLFIAGCIAAGLEAGDLYGRIFGWFYNWGFAVLVWLKLVRISGTEADVGTGIIGIPFSMLVYAVAAAIFVMWRRSRKNNRLIMRRSEPGPRALVAIMASRRPGR